MQIYLARNNVQAGPYDLNQLNIMLSSGEVLLDDLIWHDGLDTWRRIGDITGNQYTYHPAPNSSVTNHSAIKKMVDNNSIVNNVTIFPEDTDTHPKPQNDNKVSIDRLYGKPERPQADSTKKPKMDMTTNRQHTPNNHVSSDTSSTTHLASDKDVVIGNVVLAPIMSRVLATTLDWLLLIMAFLPLFIAMKNVGNMPTSFENMDAAVQYSMTLSESIPQSTQLISNIMVFGLIALQLLFIIFRGQSLGKLITGIRVVDQTTHRLPSFLKLVVVRTLLLVLLYLPFATTFIAAIMLAINYYMASKNPKNIGWHDKLAKTLVVKADSSQLLKQPK